jgi:hypothetical protein
MITAQIYFKCVRHKASPFASLEHFPMFAYEFQVGFDMRQCLLAHCGELLVNFYDRQANLVDARHRASEVLRVRYFPGCYLTIVQMAAADWLIAVRAFVAESARKE